MAHDPDPDAAAAGADARPPAVRDPDAPQVVEPDLDLDPYLPAPLEEAPPPAPPLTGGQVALRLGAGATGLTFLGASLAGAWPLAVAAMTLGGGLIFAWMGHESVAHARLARRIRRRIGQHLAPRGFTAAGRDGWRRGDEALRWLHFTDPHAASRAPAALAGKVPLPESSLELRAPLTDLPTEVSLTPADDRTGLAIEWTDHLVATGDRRFDARFTLDGPARPLLALLDGELRALLLALDGEDHPVSLADGVLRMQAPCVDDPGPAVERFDDLLRRVRARLAEPVEPRLRRQLLAAGDRGARLHRLLPCVEDMAHPAIARLVETHADRWPWLPVVRATRLGGQVLRDSLSAALASGFDSPPWGLLEPALIRLMADGADPALLLALADLDEAVHPPLVGFMLDHRPLGDPLILKLLSAPGALFAYLDAGGDSTVLPLMVAGHDPDSGAVERALRDVATHQLGRIALPAIHALGEIGDTRTAAWLKAILEDGRHTRVLARQDALLGAAQAIHRRERQAREALHAAVGGGLTVSEGGVDGRLSPAAGGELSPADHD